MTGSCTTKLLDLNNLRNALLILVCLERIHPFPSIPLKHHLFWWQPWSEAAVPFLYSPNFQYRIPFEKYSHSAVIVSLPVFLSPPLDYDLYFIFYHIESHMHRIKFSRIFGSSLNSAYSLHSFFLDKQNPMWLTAVNSGGPKEPIHIFCPQRTES